MTQEEEIASAEETAIESSATAESKPGPAAEEGSPVFSGGGVVDQEDQTCCGIFATTLTLFGPRGWRIYKEPNAGSINIMIFLHVDVSLKCDGL